MKKFTWRLEKVFEVKKLEEKSKKTELLGIANQIMSKKMELYKQRQLLCRLLKKIDSAPAEKRISEQRIFMKNCSSIDSEIAGIQQQINNLELEQSCVSEQLKQISQMRKGLERLREKAKSEYLSDYEKELKKQLDEIATRRFAKNEDDAQRLVAQEN